MVVIYIITLFRKMVRYNQFFIYCFILFGCVNTESTDTSERVSMKQNSHIQDVNDWKRDSLGCLRLRSLELARDMIEQNNLLDKSTEEFINYFGKPNEINKGGRLAKRYPFGSQSEIILIYYIETLCENDTFIIEGADKCWVWFNFRENKLKKIPEIIACE